MFAERSNHRGRPAHRRQYFGAETVYFTGGSGSSVFAVYGRHDGWYQYPFSGCGGRQVKENQYKFSYYYYY